MALVTAATIRLSVPQLLSLVAAGGLLLASVNGCTAAMAADDNQPAAPEESDPQAPPMQPETQPDARLRVGVTADARTVVEGEAATFTVTAAGAPSSGPMVVDYTVSGTASAASDYLLPSSTTTLSRGASQAKITIPTLTDNEAESQETISVALDRASTPIGTVEVDTTPATVTIAESGTAIVSVAPAPAPAREGAPAAFVVIVSGAVRSNVTVSWKSADGTAVAGTDYTAVTGGTLAFGATRRQTIRVATLQDDLNEDDETFAVILTAVSPSAGASLGRASATGTITDDDELPELTVIGGDALEDAGSLAFRVRLAPASGRLVTVLYRTVDDTAAAGQDYLWTDGTLRFTPGGPLEQTIVIPITDDGDDEADEESFKVRLHSPVNATLRDAEATGTITDNDDSRPIIESPPHLDIADSSANEGDGFMLFMVTLNRPSAEVVTVFYETNDATAEIGSDFTKTEGELTFSPGGIPSQTIRVPILQDDLDEGTQEEFTVHLLDPVNADLGDDTAVGVIRDDDDAPADDHGDTRATASSITRASPVSGRLETTTDIDFFRVTVTSSGILSAAADAGRVGDPGYPAGTVVRIEGLGFTSTNSDSVDVALVDLGLATSAELYVRVSGASATRYEVAVWLTAWTESDASFDIELRYLGTPPTDAQKSAFRAAADIWESVITRGLPRFAILDSRWGCEGSPSAFGAHIDDLLIDIRLAPIDGPSGTIGLAGPCLWRPGGLPLIGDLTIDTADLARLGTVGLQRLAVHEMAHVLGYGSSGEWDHLLRNSAVEYLQNNPGQSTLPDTHFAGQAARNAFNEIGGNSYSGGKKVPVENNTARYGAGGLDGHWRESVFGGELMTPTISVNAQTAQPLSKVTIASLADLGYRVDLTQADSFSLPSTTQSLLRVQSAQDEVSLGDHIRRGPMIVAEMPE